MYQVLVQLTEQAIQHLAITSGHWDLIFPAQRSTRQIAAELTIGCVLPIQDLLNRKKSQVYPQHATRWIDCMKASMNHRALGEINLIGVLIYDPTATRPPSFIISGSSRCISQLPSVMNSPSAVRQTVDRQRSARFQLASGPVSAAWISSSPICIIIVLARLNGAHIVSVCSMHANVIFRLRAADNSGDTQRAV